MIFFKDFKYALRLLSRSPGFTILTTLVMAAGIGLSVYLISILNTILFKDLPFKDGGSIVQINSRLNGKTQWGGLRIHDYQEIRDNVKGLKEFGAYQSTNANVSGPDGARLYEGVRAEANIFEITRTKPILGRVFVPDDVQVGAEKVIIISYDLWQSHLAGETAVIDRHLRVNGEQHRIIGIMPEGYLFPENADIWLPLYENVKHSARERNISAYGLAHIKEGYSLDQVNKEIKLIMERLQAEYPKTNTDVSAFAIPIPLSGADDGIKVVYAMHIAAILILILASVNAGNLLLSRAIERGKETAIRVALGAPRSRLITQMLWESIIICTFGGIIGLLLLAWGLELTQGITATFFVNNPSFWWKFGLDAYTLKLFFFVLISTIIVTGLIPAWKNSGGDFNALLRDGTRGALGRKSGKLNRVLVISEIFLSMTILIVASLILIAAYKNTHADYGAKTENILTASIHLYGQGYNSKDERRTFARNLQSQLENNAEIEKVSFISSLPGTYSPTPKIALEDREHEQDGAARYPVANYIAVSMDALQSLDIELKSGRYFNNSDMQTETFTAIVTESFVHRHFPGESPIGKRVQIRNSYQKHHPWRTIVGVVEHTMQGPANETAAKVASIYVPYSQSPKKNTEITIEYRSSPQVATRILRKTLQSLDPELPAFKIEAYKRSIERSSNPIRFISNIFLIFGLVAVVLAASGIYGIMSNTINQRTQEIGIKRALGAKDTYITREFLFSGVKQFLLGAIPGIIAGNVMGIAMSSSMGTTSTELVLTSISLFIIIGSTILLATYLPTKRVLTMEPNQALRYE